MYQKIAKSVFRIQNFFDEISIIDQEGIIQYCEIFSPDTYSFTADEVVGKHFFDVFPSSNTENSEIYSVLQTGRPIVSFEENCITYKGDVVKGYSSVYPLFEGKKQIGAAVALKFVGTDYAKEFIKVQNRLGIRSEGSVHYHLDDIITKDEKMCALKQKILKVSDTDSPVLIEGKTGTGKELVAQSLHNSGSRVNKPFISQNCSAIPANLLEGILFGTEKGSYTGAITSKGLFELADGGTLFLDEINSMDVHMQSKLLKAIEEKAVRRLGGHRNIHVDVRIVAAINENPFTAIAEGRLRSDLFYRLNVISLKLPELKNRPEDILYLADWYVNYYNLQKQKTLEGFSEEAQRMLMSHEWPGNVRELRNLIEGIFAVKDSGRIEKQDLPDYFCNEFYGENQQQSYQQSVENFERKLLRDTLAASKTKTEAAGKLGMTKQQLNYKLDSLHLK